MVSANAKEGRMRLISVVEAISSDSINYKRLIAPNKAFPVLSSMWSCRPCAMAAISAATTGVVRT